MFSSYLLNFKISEEFEEMALKDLYKSIGFEEEKSGKLLATNLYPLDYVKTKITVKLDSLSMFFVFGSPFQFIPLFH